MAISYVKCPYCEKLFGRKPEEENITWVKVSARRYAHKDCYDKEDKKLHKQEQEIDEFYEFIKTLFGPGYNFMMIDKQLKNMMKDHPNYTISGIQKTLNWFYNIQHHNVKDSNGGIGIVPFVYNDALQYYYKLYNANKKNQVLMKEETKVESFTIASPRIQKKKQKFSFEEDE